jgi:hypothetical protein
VTPAEILPSLIELSIAIAGFSGIAVAVQDREDRSAQARIFLTSLLWSTFNASALSVMAMVLLASPLSSSIAWTITSLVHAVTLIGVLVVRGVQRSRGEFVRTRPLVAARFFLYVLVGLQLANVVAIREPWVSVFGLGFYCFFGFGFFAFLLLEIVGPGASPSGDEN